MVAGSGRVVATMAATPVPLSSKTKTSSSNSNKSTMTQESLFDPFGIASENNNSRSLFEEEDVVVVQHQHSESSTSNIDPFGIGFSSLLSLDEKDIGEQNTAQHPPVVTNTHLLHYSPRGPPEVSRVTRPSRSTGVTRNNKASSSVTTTTTTNRGLSSSGPSSTFFGSRAAAAASNSSGSSLRTIPPKLQVRMTKYEEVSSQVFGDTVDGAGGGQAATVVSVEGSLYVQVQGSDALKNPPFCIRPSSLSPSCFTTSSPTAGGGGAGGNNSNNLSIKPNTRYTTQATAPGTMTATAFSPPSSAEGQLIVHVPKTEIGFVPVIHYSFQQTMAHLPVLLERKVTIHESSCRIALQVRSKLTNKGDLRDFCLAVAIPEHVDASTVEILRGNGTWDPLLRLIKFRLDHLPKGESFMVSAHAKLWKPHRPLPAEHHVKEGEEKVASDGMENAGAGSCDPPIVFPVMLRCASSEDQMSDVEFDAMEAPGIPCSITSLKAHSFRLLHRLT